MTARAQSAGSFPEPAAPAAPPPAAPPPAPRHPPAAPVYTVPAPVAALTSPAPVGARVPTPRRFGELAAAAAPQKGHAHPTRVPHGGAFERPRAGRWAHLLGGLRRGLGPGSEPGLCQWLWLRGHSGSGPWAAIGGRTFKCKVPITVNDGATVQRELNKCVGQAFDEVTTVVFLTVDGLSKPPAPCSSSSAWVGLPGTSARRFAEDVPEGGGGLSVSG